MAPAPSLEVASLPHRRGGLLSDTLLLGALAGVAKLAGAAKSVAVAAAFGSSPALDSYLLAFLLPSVLSDTFCGALGPVAVAALTEIEHGRGRAAFVALYSRLLRITVLSAAVGAAAIAVAILATLEFAGTGALRNGREVCRLALWMLPIIPLNAAANVWRAALNAQQRFAFPAVAVAITPAAIALSAWIERGGGSVSMLAVATSLGAAAELIVLAFAVRAAGFPLTPPACGVSSEVLPESLPSEYGYLVSSGAVSGLSLAVGQAMAASLGAGAISALNYGTRLAGVVMALGPAALGVAILPRFARIAAEGAANHLRISLRRSLWRSAVATGAVAVVLIPLSAPVVRLTLQRGAFTAADTVRVAQVQTWSLLQIPLITGVSILMRVVTALRANRVLLPLSTGALAVNVALNYGLMHRYGVAGIACASSLTQALLFAAMAWLVFGAAGVRLWKKENR